MLQTRHANILVDNTAVGTSTWANPAYAISSNDGYAQAPTTITGTAYSHYLDLRDFGFSIPENSFINTITVNIERKLTLSGAAVIKDYVLKLVKAGTISGNNKADTATAWPTTDTVASYAYSPDDWGVALTANDLNYSAFGVVLQVSIVKSGGGTSYASVDDINIVVDYTPPAGDQTIILRPNSAALDTATAMTNSGGTTAALYSYIDNYDVPDDATYIYSANSTSSYAYFSLVPEIPEGATNIKLKLYARLGGTGGRPCKYQWGVKVGATKYYMTSTTDNIANDQSVTSGWNEYNSGTTYDNNPATGAAWTVAAANTAQMGITLKNFVSVQMDLYTIQCTELWAVWSYTTASGVSGQVIIMS